MVYQNKTTVFDGDDRVTVDYGFDLDFARRHKQAPYLRVCCHRINRLGSRYGGSSGVLDQAEADRLFPGPIAGLVPYHLCSIVQPMHYLANTIFFAGERDCWGLLAGEVSPKGRVGKGKAREFDLARSSAVWPEATDEELSLPADQLRKVLEARLPGLLERMRAACAAAGIDWPEGM